VENWVRIPISISLDFVLEGSRNDNLIKVMMEALTIGFRSALGCDKPWSLISMLNIFGFT
jgi:hypothetical protein